MNEEIEFPKVAYILSSISAFPIIIGGIMLLLNSYDFLPYLPRGIFSGVLGILWGFLILVFSYRLRVDPERHMLYGILISIFAIASIYGGYWGFGIGFAFGLLGGILAVMWSPNKSEEEVLEEDGLDDAQT